MNNSLSKPGKNVDPRELELLLQNMSTKNCQSQIRKRKLIGDQQTRVLIDRILKTLLHENFSQSTSFPLPFMTVTSTENAAQVSKKYAGVAKKTSVKEE